jgi:hypothetical protein
MTNDKRRVHELRDEHGAVKCVFQSDSLSEWRDTLDRLFVGRSLRGTKGERQSALHRSGLHIVPVRK